MKKFSIILLLILSFLSFSLQPTYASSAETTLSIKQNGASSILASWVYKSPPTTQEIYLYRTRDNLLIKKLTPLATITSVLFRDLQSEENYRVVLSAKNPEQKLSKNIFLYAPPKEISKISYKYQNGYFLLEWPARNNKDIINFKLFENNTLKKEFAVSASTAGIKLANINLLFDYKLQYFTKNSTGLSNKKNIDLKISKTLVNDVKLVDFSNQNLNLEIISENASKYEIVIFENEKEISRFDHFTTLLTVNNINQFNTYKVLITPNFDNIQGVTYTFNYPKTIINNDKEKSENPLEKLPTNQEDKNKSLPIDKEDTTLSNPILEPEKVEKEPITTNKVEDIRNFKIIRWENFSVDSTMVQLNWADVFEQEYAILYRKSSKGAWIELGRTMNKSYENNAKLSKGFYQFKIIGYVDGISISESSVRSTVIKN
jgi:hypothetical protein